MSKKKKKKKVDYDCWDEWFTQIILKPDLLYTYYYMCIYIYQYYTNEFSCTQRSEFKKVEYWQNDDFNLIKSAEELSLSLTRREAQLETSWL